MADDTEYTFEAFPLHMVQHFFATEKTETNKIEAANGPLKCSNEEHVNGPFAASILFICVFSNK